MIFASDHPAEQAGGGGQEPCLLQLRPLALGTQREFHSTMKVRAWTFRVPVGTHVQADCWKKSHNAVPQALGRRQGSMLS